MKLSETTIEHDTIFLMYLFINYFHIFMKTIFYLTFKKPRKENNSFSLKKYSYGLFIEPILKFEPITVK